MSRPPEPVKSTIVAARSRRLTASLTARFGALPPGNDEQRNVELGFVETRAVNENAGVLAETFAVVRGDDQPGSLQNSAAVQLVDQLADLLIKIRDAIVISVGGKAIPRARASSCRGPTNAGSGCADNLSVGSAPKR